MTVTQESADERMRSRPITTIWCRNVDPIRSVPIALRPKARRPRLADRFKHLVGIRCVPGGTQSALRQAQTCGTSTARHTRQQSRSGQRTRVRHATCPGRRISTKRRVSTSHPHPAKGTTVAPKAPTLLPTAPTHDARAHARAAAPPRPSPRSPQRLPARASGPCFSARRVSGTSPWRPTRRWTRTRRESSAA